MSKDANVRNNLWKWLVLLLIAVGSAYLTFPIKDVRDDSGNVVQKGKVRLGLDLVGGSSFTLSIDNEKLREMVIDRLSSPDFSKLSEEDREKAIQKEIEETLQGCDDRVVEIVRRRVDAMGTNEPVIQSLPEKHRVVVQLPQTDTTDQDAARERLQKMAYLKFHLVPDNEDAMIKQLLKETSGAPKGFVREGDIFRTAAEGEGDPDAPSVANFGSDLEFGDLEESVRLIFQREKSSDGSVSFLPRFIYRREQLNGGDLESAKASAGDGLTPGYCVNFSIKKGKPADKFGRMTEANKGRQLAIVLDDELISSPVLKSKISEHGQITGNFTAAEAKRLAADLNAGALPAPLKLGAESTIDSTVGKTAISRGMWAAIIGFALVAMFMLYYYWYVGAVANVALLLDVFLLPAALFLVAHVLGSFVSDASMDGGGFKLPVLTMPGIAGLVLTLGMAVDANVLIFERIREEFARGATVGKAIENGYGRAFTAIFDSNLTTIITGCILYSVGTGPVRGFAIMLTGGVIISMFTAIVVTRLVIEHTSDAKSGKAFKMRQFFKAPKFDFMKYGRKTLLGSAIVIAVTIGLFAYRLVSDRNSVLAVDLTGGTSIVYAIEGDEPTDKEIRSALDSIDNAMKITKGDEGGVRKLIVKTGLKDQDIGERVGAALKEAFAEKTAFVQEGVEMVGSEVGEDLRKSGTKAVLFSLVVILVYVGFRFRFGFGLGGLVALAHDALISLGIYTLLGHQVSLIVVTALLTIIGYSINDTVVVFDRIRELLKHDKRLSFYDLCNQAINSCLSRTVITSVTTFFAVAALFIFGEGSIYDFALTMLIGVVAGTYSSIFIATPIMAWWYRMKRPDFDDEDAEKTEQEA